MGGILQKTVIEYDKVYSDKTSVKVNKVAA